MASATIDELFSRTLLEDYDADAPWRAVRDLQNIGSREVFEQSVEWCASQDAIKRARGADILAQLGKTADHQVNNFPDESFAVISELIRKETEAQPLSSAIYALGHIGNPQAVSLVVTFRAHPDQEIRFALAFALGNFSDDTVAVDALVELTRDVDDDVRDWSTFGLGALGKMDTPEIRDALVDRLNDSFEDVRQEAIVGLARLKDSRVIPALMLSLEQPAVADIIVDATSEMLGLENAVEGWVAEDYAAALRDKFNL
ncbi:MAG: HEAT repeat domain-containing protein [Terracidiphilus sp.]